jgi:hypothetical protein
MHLRQWCELGKTNDLTPLGTKMRMIPTAALAASFLGLSVLAAQAGDIPFSFNTPSLYGSTSDPDASSSLDNSAAVQTYMDGLLHATNASWNVTVSGAQSSGSPTNSGYTADGHVVCAGFGNSHKNCSTPDTLSTIYDTPFLMASGATNIGGDPAITMAFTGGAAVTSLSFAYEIFPTINCSNGGSGCDDPTFQFIMTSGASTVENVTMDAVEPSTSTVQCTQAAGATITGSSHTITGSVPGEYSPTSGSSMETANQCIGTMTFNFSTPVVNPTLEFVDWPPTIGITDLAWGTPGAVPEPAAILLFGAGLLGMEMFRRRRRAAV